MKKVILSALLLIQTHSFASVVGQLSRMPVSKPQSAPFRVFGQVEDFCSGTLISPRLVLTAAHCVYDLEAKKWMSVKKFTPGRDGNLSAFGSVDVEKSFVNAPYLTGDRSSDLAVLVLKEPIGLRAGWLNIAWDFSGFAPHKSALGGMSAKGTITGYPGDKDRGSMWTAACDFYVPTLKPSRPQYNCDTYGGMSGSSLIVAGPKGESLIVGVHTTGHGGFNSGVLLTEKNKAFVQQMLKAYPY